MEKLIFDTGVGLNCRVKIYQMSKDFQVHYYFNPLEKPSVIKCESEKDAFDNCFELCNKYNK